MSKISLPENPDLVSVLSEAKKSSESEAVFLLPPKPLLWNTLALKTLSSKLSEWGKRAEFKAQDKEGEALLSFFRGEKQEKKEGLKIKINWRVAPIIGGGVIFLCAAGTAVFFLLPKANLNLVVNASPLVKITEVNIDPAATTPNPEMRTLPAVKVRVEQEGSFEGEATGKKEVGSRAKGEVVVYNYDTGEDWDLSEGSILETEEGLQFLLEETVKLNEASSSANPDDPTKREINPDKDKVKVVAKEIGSSYNLKKGTRLNILDIEDHFWEDVYAVANEDFSGGESQIVKTVQKSDQETLLSQATEELTAKCTTGLSGKLVGDQKLEKKTIKSNITQKNFSPALGEETEKIKLDLKITCEGLAYSGEQLAQLLSGVLEDLVPPGFHLSSDSQKIQILTAEEAPEGQEGFVFQTRVEGKVVPEIDTEKIKEAIKGRSFADARAYLATLPHINSYEINFWPPLPPKLRRFPLKKERIQVSFSYN